MKFPGNLYAQWNLRNIVCRVWHKERFSSFSQFIFFCIDYLWEFNANLNIFTDFLVALQAIFEGILMFHVQDSSVCKVGTSQLLCRCGRTSTHSSHFQRPSIGFFPVISELTAGMCGEGEGALTRVRASVLSLGTNGQHDLNHTIIPKSNILLSIKGYWMITMFSFNSEV